MPQFILDTSGQVPIHGRRTVPNPAEFTAWEHLDAFTQGYVEALFFTEHDQGNAGFADLAPEALAQIIQDCAKFQASDAYKAVEATNDGSHPDHWACPGDEHGGHDFWLTRNGHGAGFWDGDWPEPYATELDKAAKSFGQVDVYLGDDGKVHLS